MRTNFQYSPDWPRQYAEQAEEVSHPRTLLRIPSLATLGATVASIASGASPIETTAIALVTFLATRILIKRNPQARNLPEVAICNAATLGALSSVEWSVKNLFISSIGAFLVSSSITYPLEWITGQRTNRLHALLETLLCLYIGNRLLEVDLETEEGNIFVHALTGGTLATVVFKIVDVFNKNYLTGE